MLRLAIIFCIAHPTSSSSGELKAARLLILRGGRLQQIVSVGAALDSSRTVDCNKLQWWARLLIPPERSTATNCSGGRGS